MKRFLFFLLLAFPLLLFSQSYPKNYFRSPVDYSISLAGSFAEVRKNHFHSGIDIRTDGVTGKPIRAVADGYVSRVFISSGGFGKALYVTHPNGYTSVYGHLQGFNGAIGTWVKNQQYKKESFDLDITVEPGILVVKKGELIAYSGNSGSSGGPHLHFELRDAATQEVINPLLFGLPMTDVVPPRIYRLKVYPFGENSLVNQTTNPITIEVTGNDARGHLKGNDTIQVSGSVIFGIETSDFMNAAGLKNGVNSILLSVDSEKHFYQHLERFAFSETRYVNSIIDYPTFIKSGVKIQRSYIAPNNRLSVFENLHSNGVVSFTDTKVHTIEYEVKDVYGNTSRLIFWVHSRPMVQGGRPTKREVKETFFSCKSANHFENAEVVLDLPETTLYEDLDFDYSSSSPVKGSFSKVYHLQDEYTPLHTFCNLSIKADRLPAKYKNKAVIVRIGEKGGFSSRGGTLENGWMKTQIRDFGDYTLAVDTVRPIIKAVNVVPGKRLTKQKTITMKISDNLSGVKSYRGTLNGKWILMDFDAKSGLLIYTFDDRIRSGANEFKLVVKDGVGNEALYTAKLIK